MRKVVLFTLLIVILAVGSGWALHLMGIVDLESLLLDRLQSVPAFSDRVALYRLGQIRRDEYEGLLTQLQREQALVEAARLQYEADLQALSADRAAIEGLWRELEQERHRLDREWQALYEARAVEENIQRLAMLYEQMKPSEVATVANELDDPLLIQILFAMEPRHAAAVLAELPPDRAARVSRIIAGEEK